MSRAAWWTAAVLAVTAVAAGCGGRFELPTETLEGSVIPSDQSYQMLATWTGMQGISDILLTQGSGTQLFLLFNRGGTGTARRGDVFSYSRTKPTGTPPPLPDIYFNTLFNPAALCSGGDGVAGQNNRIFVLDQGDTCLARPDPAGGCGGVRVTEPDLYWRVREFRLLGGDTVGSFTDTTMAWVNGIAADAQGRVYVAGLAIVLVSTNPSNPSIRTRSFLWRVYRYNRGLRYPGIDIGDPLLIGSKTWHRDTTWVVEDGNGIGIVLDPRGIFWSAAGGPALYVADYRKNLVQKLSDEQSSTALFGLTGAESDQLFEGPLDVTVDLQGFLYIADSGNRRVLRYGPDASYVQRVDIAKDAFGDSLANPVTVAADDSLVFVGDAVFGRVVRYKRRP
jgi:hypothetical protein